MSKKPVQESYNRIPNQVELFGRVIKTVDDSIVLNLIRVFGQARAGVNQIALCTNIGGEVIAPEELKVTYIHELLHFVLQFTGYETILRDKGIDIEQFIELLSSSIYQYEKSAKF